MPSGAGEPARVQCQGLARLVLQVKPCARWGRDTQSFVTQMYLSTSCTAWKETRCLGVAQERWGIDGQRTCTSLQRESAVGGISSSTKESLFSRNTTLISPVIISQMTDENKPKENQPTLPMQPLIPQPSAYHTKQSLANHGPVNVHRALLVLPSRLEIQVSLQDTMAPLDSAIKEEKRCPSQQKGFASITVTARRVAVHSGDPACGPGAVQEPSIMSTTSSKVSVAFRRWHPPAHTKQHTSPLKTSASCSKLAEEPRKQLFDPGIKENGVGLQSSDGREKAPPSFISRVHFQVSQRCPKSIYYLDKSLNVCIAQPRIKCQKMYRSTLSFPLKCSFPRLTADGVDGIANGKPIEDIAQSKLLGASKTPLRSHLSADFPQNRVINKRGAKEGYLGGKYPLPSVFISELPALVDVPRGPNTIVATKREDDEQSGRYHTVLALQLPKSSDEA
ncbi:PREDICTED: centrosomal protein C10orf90-like, partial [Acanthisitta chloris]|uniref:centrosomal protein C10orf90-like n=1 Tax=Acanthisitta chloris TaxID=57068 RepID=UPI0004F0CE65